MKKIKTYNNYIKLFENVIYDYNKIDINFQFCHKFLNNDNVIYVTVENFLEEVENETEEDYIKTEIQEIFEKKFKEILSINDINHIEAKKFFIITHLFDLNGFIQEIGDPDDYNDEYNELISYNISNIRVDVLLDTIEDFKNKFNKLYDDVKELENELECTIKYWQEGLDRFYFKYLFKYTSKEFQDKYSYLFDAKNFDLL